MMRVPTSPFSLLGALVLATLAACAERAAAGSDLLDEQVPEAERYGGTLVIGLPFDVADVNPLTHQTAVALFIHQYVLFLGLVAYDAQLEPRPRLARRWELDEEAGTLTFHLRDDVFWHDGVQTTAHDMQFAYERARDPRTAYPNVSTLAQYGESEVVDAFTWRVRLRPHAEYMDVWSFLVPLPRHLLQDVPPQQLARHPFNHASPVGNGPFRFVERRPGERWVFEANPDFPAELGGRPYLDRVVFRAIPEPTTMLTELLTGGIDFYYQIPPQDAEGVVGQRGVELLRAPGVRFHYLGFNHRRPPFDDVRMRRALTLAIDREAIVAAVLGGYGSLANGTISPWLAHHDPTAGADLAHDREAALALLAEAGFRSRDADGVLQDESGRALRFTILTPVTSLVNRDAGQIIQASLRQIGVDARLQVLELNTLQARVRDRERYDFDAVIWSWVPFFRNDDASLFGCGDPSAYLGYCNPRTDAVLDSALAIPDREAARPLWSRYQHRLAEELPVTFLFFPDELNAASARLRGANPDARGAWVGIERWWLDPARR